MYNTNYYLGKRNSVKPYELIISKEKTKLYSKVKQTRVWGEIKNENNYCLAYINKIYCTIYDINCNKIKKKDYLVYVPCTYKNILLFYQYVISTGDRIVKIAYKEYGKPFKGTYESNPKYKCNSTTNCCLYLIENDSIVAADCNVYYEDEENKTFFSFEVL